VGTLVASCVGRVASMGEGKRDTRGGPFTDDTALSELTEPQGCKCRCMCVDKLLY
jgi:hypothetical protein